MAVSSVVRPLLTDALAPLVHALSEHGSAIADLATHHERHRGEMLTAMLALRDRHDQIATALVRQHDLSVDMHKRLVEIAARDGRITHEDAVKLRGQIDVLVQMHLRLGREKKKGSERSARSGIYSTLFDVLGWGGEGQNLDNLLARDVPIAKNHIEHEIKKARRELQRRGRKTPGSARKQRNLFDEKTTN